MELIQWTSQDAVDFFNSISLKESSVILSSIIDNLQELAETTY